MVNNVKIESTLKPCDLVATPTGSNTKAQLQQRKVNKWEIETIGRFLTDLYHGKVVGPHTDWMAPKAVFRVEFSKFLKLKENSNLHEEFLEATGKIDIGFLLQRTNFLRHTPRGDPQYCIYNFSFFQYYNQKVEEYDQKHKKGVLLKSCLDGETQAETVASSNVAGNLDPAFAAAFEVDENVTVHALAYQGGETQDRNALFQLTNMSCYICQRNFCSPDALEEHVEDHSDESNFKLLNDYTKSEKAVFAITYSVCKNSHYFRFLVKSSQSDIIIEKIIIVTSRTFYYVNNTRVPYALNTDCMDIFFVDSHLFRKFVEQPLVIVFHKKDSSEQRFVEQHHFLRLEEFPAVRLSINPCHLSNRVLFKAKFKLPLFWPSLDIRKAATSTDVEERLCEMSTYFHDYFHNNKLLTQQNMRGVLLKLLQLEDSDTIREYNSLVQRNVKLRKYEKEYTLKVKVPNHIFLENIIFPYDDVVVLSEENGSNLNSVDTTINMIEDIIDPTKKKKKKSKRYLGQIDRISNGRVTFVCDQKIPEGKLYTILFRPSRMVLRYQYRALEQLVAMPPILLKRFFFPQQIVSKPLPSITIDLLNKTISTNPEQLKAICHVVGAQSDSAAPYIIFGPPGTGKTTTIVEAIWQIYNLQPKSHILIMAGSNGACDEIALRLCKILSPLNHIKAITRIYSRSCERRAENINDLLLEYSNMYSQHFYPGMDVLHEYRIIVCTLSMVGKLATGRFGKNSKGDSVFTHVFVDEAAASTEAETLVGLLNSLSANCNLIISGDHKQLGPILNSNRAGELGLSMSLMERLLKLDCYHVDQLGKYNDSIQMLLCRNYRSHPAIVDLYNQLYYGGRLKAMASNKVKQLGKDWHRSPNSDYPIIFHSVFGTQQRERNSTSWHNPMELAAVMDYVKDLMYFGVKGKKIEQSDIGIISPYKKQYMRIQEELNMRNWYQIETGAVEVFQGKEKPIIIVSFVRSFSSGLGFLDSPRRFNVLLSRAKSLLILIGNPKTLSMNADFKYVIDKCIENKTMVGANYYELSELGAIPRGQSNSSTNMRNVTKSLEKLSLTKENLGELESKTKRKRNRKKNNGENINEKGNNVAERSSNNQMHLNKENNAFKPAKVVSPEKQRKMFAIYKQIYLDDDEETSDEDDSESQINRESIETIFADLPRVPQFKPMQSQSEMQFRQPQALPRPPEVAPVQLQPQPTQQQPQSLSSSSLQDPWQTRQQSTAPIMRNTTAQSNIFTAIPQDRRNQYIFREPIYRPRGFEHPKKKSDCVIL